jgi:hypothetical protein
MDKIKKSLKKLLFSYRHLPEKKQYVEFFTALLTVPVLITVLALNLNNLKTTNKKPTTQNTTVNSSSNNTPEKIYISAPTSAAVPVNTISVTEAPCKPGIGSISIDSPQEGDTVSDNPVSIDISYKTNGYCQVVWSYRINGGGWSDYDDKSIALYNLPQGNIKLDLRVKSIVSDDQKTLTRNFVYKGNTVAATATPIENGTKTSSTSAN